MGIISQSLDKVIAKANYGFADVLLPTLTPILDEPVQVPTWDAERFEPAPEDEAWLLGYELASNPTATPARGMTESWLTSYFAGQTQAERDEIMARWFARDEFEAWLDGVNRANDQATMSWEV